VPQNQHFVKSEDSVEHKEREKKLRLLVRKANKEHKKQAKKIDILCNDLIAAQKEFIKRLDIISFTAHFYKSILGATELNELIFTAGRLIKDEVPDVNVAFFLRQSKNYELFMFESEHPIALDKKQIENCFGRELVEDVCKLNKVCTLDCLFEMGLQGNPVILNNISAFTIPVSHSGTSQGFILIYRSSQYKLSTEEVDKIAGISSGLSLAIISCQAVGQSAD
jgi:hypothetical protein